MASAPSAQSPVLSASASSMRRVAMQRSSETIGTIAAALAKAQAQLVNPEKSLGGDQTIRASERIRTVIPICATIERTRHYAQDLKPA